MTNNIAGRLANTWLLRYIGRAVLFRRLVRTAFARKSADLMHKIARRVEIANGQSPSLEASQWTVPAMPEWVEEEMRTVAHLEPELIPPGVGLSKYSFYSVPADPAPGDAYFRLLESVGNEKFTHVLLVPWLRQGGADRGILYHVRAIAESDSAARVLVIATERADSPWAEKLPSSARYVEFGAIAGHLEFDKQITVLVRLMVQLQVPTIHLVNSRVGWEMVRQYGRALRQRSRLYASLFCDEYDERMLPVGYARTYLRDCYQEFVTIFCDNSHYPQVWSRDLGIPQTSFTVLPYPYDGNMDATPVEAITRTNAQRVLWAGRLDRQKRPDVLAKIASSMPDVNFDVYGKAVMSAHGECSLERLSSLPNVVLHGEFKRLEDIVSADHFAYLHTTSWEGTPTILFDVAASGLPICAPAVGGIADFLAECDLVRDPEDVEAFVNRLEALRDSKQERDDLVGRQREALLSQRGWADFLGRLRIADQRCGIKVYG